jgi:hypothetical protein
VARLFRRQRALDPQEVFRAVGRVASELGSIARPPPSPESAMTARPLRRRETSSPAVFGPD